jgi:hypothetical protein
LNDWQMKPKQSEKTCIGAALFTTNPIWCDPGLNTGRRGGKPATIRLSIGATLPCPVSALLLRTDITKRIRHSWDRLCGLVLAADLEVRVRFPSLPDFLRSSRFRTESAQLREYNWGATWKKK